MINLPHTLRHIRVLPPFQGIFPSLFPGATNHADPITEKDLAEADPNYQTVNEDMACLTSPVVRGLEEQYEARYYVITGPMETVRLNDYLIPRDDVDSGIYDTSINSLWVERVQRFTTHNQVTVRLVAPPNDQRTGGAHVVYFDGNGNKHGIVVPREYFVAPNV